MDKDGGMMAKYYLMEAGMVDLSCQGGCLPACLECGWDPAPARPCLPARLPAWRVGGRAARA